MHSTVSWRCLANLTGFVVLAASRLPAQTPQTESPVHSGAWILGGTGSFDIANDPNSQRSLSLSPSALTFVMPRFALGAAGALNLGSNNTGHTTVVGIGPTARLFLNDPSERVLMFVSGTVLPEWAHQFSRPNVDFDERAITLDASLGATYLLTSRAGLTGEAYATHFDVRTTTPGVSTASVGGTTHYGLRFGFTVFVH